MHRNARILTLVAAVIGTTGLASCGRNQPETAECDVEACRALLAGSMDSVVVEARFDSVVVEASRVVTFQGGTVDSTDFVPGTRLLLIRR